jgi:cysteine desulfurase/selenocysteine lyase
MSGPHPPIPTRRRLYLDNAATSFPKPPAVAEAMARFAAENGASPRGRFAEAREAGALVHRCRQRICELINGESAEHVVFTLNTTDALNLAIHGVVRPHLRAGRRPHVVTTWFDHNSVLRPYNALALDGVEQTRVPCDQRTGRVDPEDVRRAVRGDTVLVAVNHASNVTGVVQDVGAIGRSVREAGDGVLYLVDGAQSLGHTEVDVQAMQIDLLAFPGHKGLLGPTGTGGLYIRPGVEGLVEPVRQGGTGSRSELDVQPEMMPDRYEPGSHNTVGIIGLGEGVAWLLDRGMGAVAAHERELCEAFLRCAAELPRALRVLGPTGAEGRVGVFSVVHESLSPAQLADAMEERHGVLTRAGLHCAPLAHRALGTAPPSGAGAMRMSVGPFVTVEDVRVAVAALGEVVGEGTGHRA